MSFIAESQVAECQVAESQGVESREAVLVIDIGGYFSGTAAEKQSRGRLAKHAGRLGFCSSVVTASQVN
jgi:hypothetical protein